MRIATPGRPDRWRFAPKALLGAIASALRPPPGPPRGEGGLTDTALWYAVLAADPEAAWIIPWFEERRQKDDEDDRGAG